MVISTQIRWFSADCSQFAHNGIFPICQGLGDRREFCRQFSIVALRGKRFGPIACEPIMAVAVVWLSYFPTRAAVMIKNTLCCGLNRLTQNLGFSITASVGKELEAFTQRTKFAQLPP